MRRVFGFKYINTLEIKGIIINPSMIILLIASK